MLKIVPRPAGRVCVAHSVPWHAQTSARSWERVAGSCSRRFAGNAAWIAHLSYANLAAFATFAGRYVVRVDANGSASSGIGVSADCSGWPL